MLKVPTIERNRRLAGSERGRIGAQLLREYDAGRSIRQICADSGYSIGRVRRLLQEAGVEFRSRGGATREK
jgi:hypothetical protein